VKIRQIRLIGGLFRAEIIVGWSDRVQRGLLTVGWIVSAVLLFRFAIDFWTAMPWWLAVPFILLVTISVWRAGVNAISAFFVEPSTARHSRVQGLLLAAIPLGFVASSLDCTGLSLHGCSSYCTFVKLALIPVIAIGCFVYFFSGSQVLLTTILATSFITLVPHCVCYNIGNGWWIDRLGASPTCYGWGFVVALISAGALRSAVSLWTSAVVCFTIIAGATAFFVSHHFFHFPW
jgi:hypothetical protein